MDLKIATKNNISTVLLCAFKYAITRRSHVVDAVIKEINNSWSDICIDDKEVMAKEILANSSELNQADLDKWMEIVDRFKEESVHCE